MCFPTLVAGYMHLYFPFLRVDSLNSLCLLCLPRVSTLVLVFICCSQQIKTYGLKIMECKEIIDCMQFPIVNCYSQETTSKDCSKYCDVNVSITTNWCSRYSFGRESM